LTTKYKNILIDKISESGSLTDKTLFKNLVKDGHNLSDAIFNKTLLDMEIMGLVKINWLTKDTRRIEIVSSKEEEDEVEIQNEKTLKKEYENSFPESNDDT
jgi:hypothetical protein